MKDGWGGGVSLQPHMSKGYNLNAKKFQAFPVLSQGIVKKRYLLQGLTWFDCLIKSQPGYSVRCKYFFLDYKMSFYTSIFRGEQSTLDLLDALKRLLRSSRRKWLWQFFRTLTEIIFISLLAAAFKVDPDVKKWYADVSNLELNSASLMKSRNRSNTFVYW